MATQANTNKSIVGSNAYLACLCGKCKEAMTLTGRMIDFVAVCEFCYENYRITHNPVERRPYKKPRSRKLPTKPKPMEVITSNANTIKEDWFQHSW
jgi:hypothetical protein